MNESLHTTENTGARTPQVSRPVAVTAPAAAPASATAGSTATPKAAAGQDRPELQKAIQAVVDLGFAGCRCA